MSSEPLTPPTPVGTRTIHFGLRVSDRRRSLDFYRSLGYEVVGTVPETEIGHLTMLKLPGDEFVTIELVADPPDASPPGLSHIVVTVDSLDDAVAALRAEGVTDATTPEPPEDPDTPRTVTITDPDGTQIELVQWPRGHANGLTAADWADTNDAPTD
jgi:lactoylglutathione lyase